MVLTQRAIMLRLPLPEGTRGVLLDGGDWDDESLGAASADGLQGLALAAGHLDAQHLHGSHLAYMIYTSGSTGKPKGSVEHA